MLKTIAFLKKNLLRNPKKNFLRNSLRVTTNVNTQVQNGIPVLDFRAMDMKMPGFFKEI